jgi:hypothetical protein
MYKKIFFVPFKDVISNTLCASHTQSYTAHMKIKFRRDPRFVGAAPALYSKINS